MADETQNLISAQEELLDAFEVVWQRGEMPQIRDFLPGSDRSDGALLRSVLLELVVVDLWYRWRRAADSGKQVASDTVAWATVPQGVVDRLPGRPLLEDYVQAYPELGSLQALPFDVVAEEYRARVRWGHDATEADYLARFPAHSQALPARLAAVREEVRAAASFGDCGTVAFDRRKIAATDAAGAVELAPNLPQNIGRYRVERILGQGNFGLVYLARDDQLQRLVAIKVPHRRLVSRPEDAQAYLVEARTVANLDHPNIVPVHDIGNTAQFPCFLVSKYIDGTTLSARMAQSRLPFDEAAELAATVAGALHHAHKQGLVHRDIKPGNILLDKSGTPFVADFGLALREHDLGKGPCYVGTPAYMSPEQARGEGHRVDGRSDVFSLGVVLYELLIGQRPFKADSQEELLEQISSCEARPPRQMDDRIPKELDRICLKALSKRASERYSAAKDMADDLRCFLAEARTPTLRPTPPSLPLGPPVKIVPKGLRSFDAHDANFFIELLPGPRDRDGLPDSIRFWKTRVEESEAERTFSVGLICGPSGCGKSSLMKAGLLPRLSDGIVAVYVEATAGETETRLMNGLRKRCPALPADLGLKEMLAALRQGQGLPAGTKLLIVLDQFEQWLHAQEDGTELVQALRQADGGRVQCIVLVRDDFWMAVIRFMRELEIRLVDDENSMVVDLFDVDHARKVLAAFGRAFGRLPENLGEISKEQSEFLNQAVSALAQEGLVVSVRLALFAEMMKGKPWTPSSLKAVGGIEGVGLTFLEEMFSAAMAPPEHRYHQKAARAALNVLLPDFGTDIKGSMRSYPELLEASGYGDRPRDFADLIHILDNEVRLITPTDPAGHEMANDVPSQGQAGGKYYQLTHDYLVHSIRDWLTRKQKETPRGRAKLLLADLATVWNSRPENRQLPSLWQWCSIRCLTDKRSWTPPQVKMMRKATRYHGVWGLVVAVLLALAAWGWYENHGNSEAHDLRDQLLTANTNEDLLNLLPQMAPYRRWLDPLLRETYAQAETDNVRRKQLLASLALLPVDASQVAYLNGRVLDAGPDELRMILDALAPHKDALQVEKWRAEIDRNLPPDAEEPAKETLAKRKANAAVALLKMNQQADVWPLLKHGADPRVRTYLIHRLAGLGADVSVVIRRLADEPDITILRALLLSLGEFDEASLPAEQRAILLPKLHEMYTMESDPGLHAAAEWLLRTWKQETWLKQVNDQWATERATQEKRLEGIQQLLMHAKARVPSQWYVNGQGQTMVVIAGPVVFMMGSPATEAHRQAEETQHKVRIDRTFAIAGKPVTVEQYRKFDPGYESKSLEFRTRTDFPAVRIDWYMAAEYCNWLSVQERIPAEQQCYQTKGAGIQPKANYLSLIGYRLPTEAEMEFAIRAEARTSGYFGEGEDLLPKYAWYMKNSRDRIWPAGYLKPNDFGLFDVHGNVNTWCQESYHEYPRGAETSDDKEYDIASAPTPLRVVRGGSFDHPASSVRSAYRDYYPPSFRDIYVGLRVARTLRPSPEAGRRSSP